MWPFYVELYLYEEKKGRYSQYRTDMYSLSSVMALFRRAARAVELIDTNISLQHFHIEKRPKVQWFAQHLSRAVGSSSHIHITCSICSYLRLFRYQLLLIDS